MQLVEQHVINQNNPRFQTIDEAAFASKNLYNAANYIIRQEFIKNNRYIPYSRLAKQMKDTDEYSFLPAKVAQQVLRILDKNWQSFFAAIEEWKANPSKFNGRPRLPKYKDKQKGRNLLIYTIQAISKPQLKKGIIKPSGLDIYVKTKQKEVNQVRIVPRKTHYVIEVIYTQQEIQAEVNKNYIAGVDIGLNNLAAVASNKPGFVPLLVNGRPLKSINQFYNKRRAQLVSQLMEGVSGEGPACSEIEFPQKGTSTKPDRSALSSTRIQRLTLKRNHRIKHELHVASFNIIDHLVKEQIGTLVIGKNKNWKLKINIGSRNNQNFVSIPHARFVEMLKYKAELQGIQVYTTKEGYTSKCSFLDREPIEKHDVYMGRRIKRGLFRSKEGILINADINGACNIIRKVAPNAFADGVEGAVVR
ncbi:TPA: transposase, partial [Candidatus Poribacteria bacterium]|nr:transposase [Candidatus Poribacteria bacterium]